MASFPSQPLVQNGRKSRLNRLDRLPLEHIAKGPGQEVLSLLDRSGIVQGQALASMGTHYHAACTQHALSKGVQIGCMPRTGE